MTVSKSRFLSGGQCVRRAYLEFHSPELAKPPSAADVERMRAGQEVGRLARQLYDGVLIDQPSTNMDLAAGDTWRAIESGVGAVFEGAFVTDHAEVRVDILERLASGGWHIIEVKSSKTAKPEHLTDVAFQRAVVTDAGLAVEKCSLMLVSGDYESDDGPFDVSKFFVLEDVTEATAGLIVSIRDQAARLVEVLSRDAAPEVVPNVHCKRDGECPFLATCWRGYPVHDVTTLPLIRAEVVHELHDLGVRDISNIPLGTKLSARQRLITSVVQTGVPFVSEDLGGVLACMEYPLHFLDFESTNSAVPAYRGTAPYRHVPFQWSDHVMDAAGGGVRHAEFLHRDKSDPRPEFARSLWQALSGAGTVFYYSSYEKSILKGLAADDVPCAALALQAIEELGVDLEKVVKEHVYLSEFFGRTSIKKVYPALVPGGGYAGLAIQDGETAASEFRRMLSPATTELESQRIATELLQYCERDTLAMLEVFRALEHLAMTPSSPND